MCNQKHQALFLALLAFLLPSVLKADNVAKVGDVEYETLQAAFDAAEAEDIKDIVVDLLADATLDITAWDGTKNPLSIGTVNTESITINGNSHTLTFNQRNSDWNDVATMNDAQTKLVLNNMHITSSGHNDGPWNRHDINFNCAVELNNVTSDKALAFKNSATLKKVTVTDNSGDIYGIWISPRVEGQKIEIDGLNVTCGRGIKIDDQYVDNPVPVSLDIQNATFNTTNKSAIVVKSAAETTIKAGEGIDISNVAADNTNLVWVDEDRANEYYKVTVEGAKLAPEGGEGKYVASLVRGEQTRGYYNTLAAAYASTDFAEGDSYKLHQATTEAVKIAKVLTIVKNSFTAANVSAAEGYKKTETDKEIAIAKFLPVCEIANVKYETLEEAFAAAQDGQTITLLDDCAGNGIIAPQGKFTTGITVDFAKHTYTVDGSTVGSTGTETNGFQLLKNNKITFKNGTITSEKAKILIQNYSNLTLEGMTLTLNKAGYTSAYTLSNNCGNVVIDGSTINANPAGGFAFDVCRYSSYPSVNVEVKGKSQINGNIEISASGSDAKDGFGLKLTAGTLTGDIVMDPSAVAAMAATPDKAVIAKSADFEANAPEGYKWVEGENGMSTLAACEYVAQVGDAKYETFEAAFAAVGDGQTITLLSDCAGNGIKAPQGKFATGITVDFAGHTYTVDGSTVGSTGTETNGFQLLKDNKITFKNGTITSEKAKILIQNYSNLTLEGMTLTLNNTNYTGAYTLSNNNGNIVIDGSTINANPAGGFAFDVCRYSSYPSVNVEVKGESQINGNIEISASGNDAKDGFGLKLTAGKLTGDIVMDPSAAAAMAATPDKVVIAKSADFTAEAPKDYKWVEAESGMQKLVVCEYVAQVGEDKYETFEAAFAAVGDGQTITLLADCTGNGIKAPQAKFTTGITVDFDGHTYTVDGATVGSTGTETNGFQLLKDNKITFKNGTITSEKAKILIQNYSNLTLEGMTLTLNKAGYTSAYTLSNNCGNVVIDGSTINANPAGGFAFDVCRYSSYPSVNVEVKGKSQINGNIEIFASGSDAKDGFGLKLTAGTLTGDIVMDPSAAAAMAATPDKVVIAKSADFTAEAPKDYKWVEAESGMQKLVACEYVAQVGEDKYETFEAAAEAAGENVIMLLADIEDNYTLTSGKTLKVNKNGKTLNVVAAEGSILDETTDGDVTTYTAALASETDIVLVDGEPYTFTADTQVKSATYTRKYAADRVGKFQAWSMPFDFTITEEAAEKFTFYRINMIAHSANPNEEVQSTDKLWVYVAPMKAGEKLTANRPYAYKPKTEGEFTFTADNNKLFAPDYTSRLHTETVDHSYDFFGTYNTVSIANQGGDFYYLNADGEISHATQKATTVGSYRWIVKATNKSGANYAPRFEFVEEGAETEGIRSISAGDDVEGYYTLGGTRVETPHHGMFVVKYKNGNIKKQFIK